ncbi:hypothetical protein FOZ76_14525 [Verticiella sediminum]|uniref:Uncharacterized protein n=1 Tax=Verticiella sediminum TaxID=1247510 RepID=A0A556AIC2_9BURK|nr:hypothetical protein [Verticiella sediminum]TSH92633.1 hypothetical protein FOZ76_14525 [Verticiella sediminum]
MAYTQADLDQAKRDLIAAQSEVQYGDKRVKLLAVEERLRLVNLIQDDLNAQARRRRPRMYHMVNKGKGM